MITLLNVTASSALQAASILLLALAILLIAKPTILSGPSATVTIERSVRILATLAPISMGCLVLSAMLVA